MYIKYGIECQCNKKFGHGEKELEGTCSLRVVEIHESFPL